MRSLHDYRLCDASIIEKRLLKVDHLLRDAEMMSEDIKTTRETSVYRVALARAFKVHPKFLDDVLESYRTKLVKRRNRLIDLFWHAKESVSPSIISKIVNHG